MNVGGKELITEGRMKQLEANAVEPEQSGGTGKPEKPVARLRQGAHRFGCPFLGAPEVVANLLLR